MLFFCVWHYPGLYSILLFILIFIMLLLSLDIYYFLKIQKEKKYAKQCALGCKEIFWFIFRCALMRRADEKLMSDGDDDTRTDRSIMRNARLYYV